MRIEGLEHRFCCIQSEKNMSDRAPSPPPAADYSPPADGGPYASTIYAMYGPAPLAPAAQVATASPQPPQPPQQGIRDVMDIEINGRTVAELGIVMDLVAGRVHSIIGWELAKGVCEVDKEAALRAIQHAIDAKPYLRKVF